MRNLNTLPLILCTFIACGGSGSSEADVPNYSGAWSGNVSLVSNTCPRQIPDEFISINILHNVTQSTSEDALGNKFVDIVIEDGKDSYIGVGESDISKPTLSFRATGNPNELPGFLKGFTCIEILSFQYSSVNTTPDNSGFVQAGYLERQSTITCSNSKEVRNCDVTYTGTAFGQR